MSSDTCLYNNPNLKVVDYFKANFDFNRNNAPTTECIITKIDGNMILFEEVTTGDVDVFDLLSYNAGNSYLLKNKNREIKLKKLLD